MTDLRPAAIAYAAAGWPVFPLGRRSKLPAIPKDDGGNGCLDATTDTDRVARWWRRNPDHNIGLRTGEAFDALDVDDLAALDDYCAGREPVVGPTVATGSGGWHVYVAATGLGNRAKFIPGCDWRGRNGYVVAPPSIHPDTGAPYRWHEAAGPDASVVPAPAWLLDALRPQPAVPLIRRPEAPGCAYGRRALESEVAQVALAPVGERNHTLNVAALKLGQLVAGGVLDADEVVDSLLVAALRSGLGPREAEATILSGLTGGMRTPRRVPA